MAEVETSPEDLQQYLAEQCRMLLALPNFMDFLPGLIFPDEILADRVTSVAQRITQIAKTIQV